MNSLRITYLDTLFKLRGQSRREELVQNNRQNPLINTRYCPYIFPHTLIIDNPNR